MSSEIDADAELIFKIAALFFEGNNGKGMNASEILERLKPEFPALTRESIYPRLARARALEYIKFVPPLNGRIADQIKEKFPNSKKTEVLVVQTRGAPYNEAVSAAAAELALHLLQGYLTKGESSVGLGLGPGKATLDFAKNLSERLRQSIGVPQVALFAITAGCLPTAPELAPVSFFNLFPSHRISKRVALFAETLVRAKDFPRMKQQIGVKEAFQAKSDIRIIVTALGDATDPHDLLVRFLKEAGKDIAEMGAIGNVQYRPFSARGVIHEKPDDLRAVTLFELEELVQLARQKDRHVILIARQCGLCERNRANVLRLLLEREDLMVFSHLVLDLPTAEALLRPHVDSTPARTASGKPHRRH
jgi:hypothetical protein